jgi:two-component system, NtrC family, response regulator AtoC
MMSVLFIDSDTDLHTSLKIILPPEFSILSAYNGDMGLAMLRSASPETILLGTNLPDIDSVDLLHQITSSLHYPPVIVVSDKEDISLITKSMRLGAHDFLKKPIELKKLKTSMLSAMQLNCSQYTGIDKEETPSALSEIIGNSRKMQQVKGVLLRYAPSNFPILITGESGSGKEIIASTIHKYSQRRDGPLVAINCGAIPPTLMHSELFGSEKGAFTDAVLRPGSFEQANQGSLFLDEIGEMDPAAQVQLLRAIESREIKRIGGIRKIRLDIRIIAATNKNLAEAIKEKVFRKDLFYRINTLTLHIPPLRDRKSDIPLLAKHFLQTAGHINYALSIGALQKLSDYLWPGNVRELKAAIERALLPTDGEKIEARHISFNQ